EHAEARRAATRCRVAARDDARLAEAREFVLAADARRDPLALDLELAEQLEEHHLLLERLEHRVDGALEILFAAREVRRARHHEAVLPVRRDLLAERRDDGLDDVPLLARELRGDAPQPRGGIGKRDAVELRV